MKISPPKLRQLRQQQGWTQRDLADHLDVDPMSVSRWERGLSRPRRAIRDRLLALLAEMPATDAERVDELVRTVGLDTALRALRQIALLARKPAVVRFVDDPTKRLREVEVALREQSELIARAKIQ